MNQSQGSIGRWNSVKFGAICKVQGGFAFKSSEYQQTGIPIVRISNLVNGKVSLGENTVYASDNKISTYKEFILQKGDVLIAMSGATTGKMAIFDLDVPALLNQRVGRFRILSEESCAPKFVSYLVSQITKKVLKEAYGAAQPNISPSQIEEIEVPLPPLEDQRLIVAEIEKQFTRLDAGIAALKRVQANLKRYRAAVLKAACEGNLVPTEAELAKREKRTYETGEELLKRILDERRKNWSGRGRYADPAEPNASELSKLPQGWAWASIEQVVKNFDGQRIPLKSEDRDKRSGQYPYYGASGIIDDIDDYLFDGDFLLIAEDGANLLSRSTPIAFKASGKFWVNNHAHIVQMYGGIPLSYLAFFLNGKDLALSITGSAQPKLTQAALNKIMLPIPPLNEQTRIVSEVERRLSVVDEIEGVVKLNLDRAIRLRQSILQKAFSGEL